MKFVHDLFTFWFFDHFIYGILSRWTEMCACIWCECVNKSVIHVHFVRQCVCWQRNFLFMNGKEIGFAGNQHMNWTHFFFFRRRSSCRANIHYNWSNSPIFRKWDWTTSQMQCLSKCEASGIFKDHICNKHLRLNDKQCNDYMMVNPYLCNALLVSG